MTRPDQTFRATEGSGPWLHPPRKTERRSPWLAIWAIGFVVAGVLATFALGAPPPMPPDPAAGCNSDGGC